VAIPRQPDPHNGFDEHRNTSRVFPPPPGAVTDALKASKAYTKRYPKHARWLADGHPTMNEDEHWERFGTVYKKGELT
jgi:hypothetical protein